MSISQWKLWECEGRLLNFTDPDPRKLNGSFLLVQLRSACHILDAAQSAYSDLASDWVKFVRTSRHSATQVLPGMDQNVPNLSYVRGTSDYVPVSKSQNVGTSLTCSSFCSSKYMVLNYVFLVLPSQSLSIMILRKWSTFRVSFHCSYTFSGALVQSPWAVLDWCG